MRQSGLLLDDNREVSEACVTRPLVEIGFVAERNMPSGERLAVDK